MEFVKANALLLAGMQWSLVPRRKMREHQCVRCQGFVVSITKPLHVLAVLKTPLLLNSARLHKVFQTFVVPWKLHTSQKMKTATL
jgi:hypothetical protein